MGEREVGCDAGPGGGPVMAPGPVAGLVELVLVQARGGGPVAGAGLAQGTGGGPALAGAAPGRGLVPPGVPELACGGAERRGDGAGLAVTDPPHQRGGHAERAGDPGAVVSDRDQ